jgi:hypothetical protein
MRPFLGGREGVNEMWGGGVSIVDTVCVYVCVWGGGEKEKGGGGAGSPDQWP